MTVTVTPVAGSYTVGQDAANSHRGGQHGERFRTA